MQRSPNIYCCRCRHPLCGLTSSACPECGHAFDSADPSTYLTTPVPTGRTLAGIAVILSTLPLLSSIALHATWLAGRLQLGHWPRSYLDDPNDIGGGLFQLLDVTAGLLLLSTGLFVPLALTLAVAAIAQRALAERRLRLGQLSPILISIAVIAAGLACLAADPFRVLDLFMD